jgi:hypothetical protein
MAIQFAAAFGSVHRSTPLFMATCFATLFWWTAFDLLNMDKKAVALILGGGLVLTAIGIGRSAHRDITPVWYLVGSATFLYGFFDTVERTPFEISFLLVAAGFVYLSTLLHTRTLLFVATSRTRSAGRSRSSPSECS